MDGVMEKKRHTMLQMEAYAQRKKHETSHGEESHEMTHVEHALHQIT